MNRFRMSFLMFLAWLLWMCACAGSRWGREINWTDFELRNLPSQEVYPEADAVILLDEANVEITQAGDTPFSVMTRHRIVKILNEKGFRHANFVIPFDDNTEITHLKARTIRPDGKIVMHDPERVFDTSLYPDYVFYSDVRGRRFTMPAVEVGAVLEYEWQLQVRNFTLWTRWPFQQADPVMISRYTIRCPRNWEIKWKTYGIHVSPRQTADGSRFTIYGWEIRDSEPLRPETGIPPGMSEQPSLLFSPVGMTDWNHIAAWYHHLAEDRMKSDRFIRTAVDSLVRGQLSDEQKLKRIYEFVRDRVRYLAIEIGIGGYQPHPAPEIFRNLYGDCKDMATLIVAMAGAAGIDADPVLISTWQNGDLDTSIVSPAQFNHAIAVATLPDGRDIWMDATDKQCAFGELPWYDR
ncbi:DUF3857 and transglutaminase domain-containing protein, partial [bacterium]|nr:DUF3857 and transglutaminase domain-containing protein [bacterium]